MPLNRLRATPSADVQQRFTRALRRAAPIEIEGLELESNATRDCATKLRATIAVFQEAQSTVSELGEVATSALAETDPAERAILSERYEALFQSLQKIADGAPPNLAAANAEEIQLGMPGNATFIIKPVPFDPTGPTFYIALPAEGFSNAAEITRILDHIDKAALAIDRTLLTFTSDLRYVERKIAS